MTKRKQPNVMLYALQDMKREIKKRHLPEKEEQAIIIKLEPLYIEIPKDGGHAFWGEQAYINQDQWNDIKTAINRELLDTEKKAIQETLNTIKTIYTHNNKTQLRTQVIKAELVKITKQKEQDVIYVFNMCSNETRSKIDIFYWQVQKIQGIEAATAKDIQTIAKLTLKELRTKSTRRNTSYLPLLVHHAFRLWALLGQTNFKPKGSEKLRKQGGYFEPPPQSLTHFIRILSDSFANQAPHISDINKLIRKSSKMYPILA